MDSAQRRTLWQAIWITAIGVVVIGLLYFIFFAVPVSGRIVSFVPLDEANLEVLIEFTNEGDRATEISCRVTASDASRQVGFERLGTREAVPAGESVTLRGTVRIEDEGAYRVVDANAEACEAD